MDSNRERIKANFADVEAYDRRIKRFVPYYEEMMASVLACLSQIENRCSILELGCGTGNLSLKMLEKAPNARLTAVDLVDEMVQACRERLINYQERTDFICADMVEFCRPGAFDYVLSNLALHYPETDKKKLQTCRNVFKSLKPGGFFSFSVMLDGETQELRQRIWKMWEQDVLENGVSSAELEEWCTTCHKTDYPVPSSLWFRWLKETGFTYYDLIWFETIFGTIWARKPSRRITDSLQNHFSLKKDRVRRTSENLRAGNE